MANPKGNEASLKDSRFKAAWRSGTTRTIRVPVILADATLEYAHRLDNDIESPDTMNRGNSEVENSISQFIDTSDSTDEVIRLKAEVERLQIELGNLQAEAEASPPSNLTSKAGDLYSLFKELLPPKAKMPNGVTSKIKKILEG